MSPRLGVKFWGVRGSRPTPCRANLRYGGNTACVEIRLPGGKALLLDGGSGLARVGDGMAFGAEAHILLSHYHRDHVDGIPFFTPLYQPGRTVTFYGPAEYGPPEETLRGVMAAPYFPVDLDATASNKRFVAVRGGSLQVAGVVVWPFPLNHPQGSVGYRLEANGAVVVYATDREHGDARLDQTLLEQCRGVDMLICDAQYTPEEYESHRGWGHSTWLEAARLARQAEVGRLILFHHDPARDDAALDRIVEQAREVFTPTDAAREEWEVWI